MSERPANVVSLPGQTAPVLDQYAPSNPGLIAALEDALALAKDGRLQCLIGTGFTRDAMTFQIWSDYHEDVYQMMGALAWLQSEYAHRHTPNWEDA